MDDATKGDFAEWVVARLLGLPLNHGGYVSGANYDFVAPSGVTIEVKSSSYWQSWKLYDSEASKAGRWRSEEELRDLRPVSDGKVIFTGLYRRTIHGSKLSAEPGFKADLYIFAFQNEADPRKWDALDLDQWEFYATRRVTLEQEKRARDATYKAEPPKGFTISLARLRELSGGKGMTAPELRAKAGALLQPH